MTPDLELTPCAGCAIEVSMLRAIASVDAATVPQLIAAERQLRAENRDEASVSEAHRELRAVHERRWQLLDGIARRFGPLAGCLGMVVRGDAAVRDPLQR